MHISFLSRITTRTKGYLHPDLARAGGYFTNPSNMHEAVRREIEKQQIREQIIASEEELRRQLETEVRMAMMMEREMALRGTHAHEFPIFSGPSTMLMDSRLPILNNSENVFREAMPFSRKSEVRITELKASPEVKKERVILLPKPEENISGIKRKAMTPPAVEMPTTDLKKKKQEILHCELCQVSATSERALREHFQGKKHRSREARQSSQIAGENFAIGLFSRKTINSPSKLSKLTKDFEEKQEEVVLEKLVVEENDSVALQVTKNSVDIKNDEVATTKKVEKDSLKFKFWCPMCKIGTFSQKVLNAHMRGKRHISLLLKSLNSRSSDVSDNENISGNTVRKEVNQGKADISGGSKDGEEMEKPQVRNSVKEEN